MKVHEKVTVWTEVDVPEEFEKTVLEAFKSGVVKNINELYDYLSDENITLKHEILYGTEEGIELDILKEEPTVELIDRDPFLGNNTIWNNLTPVPMEYDLWLMANEDDVNIELATSGADRELNFNPEHEFLSRYNKYVKSFLK